MRSRGDSFLDRIFDKRRFIYFSKLRFLIGSQTEVLEFGSLTENLKLSLLEGTTRGSEQRSLTISSVLARRGKLRILFMVSNEVMYRDIAFPYSEHAKKSSCVTSW